MIQTLTLSPTIAAPPTQSLEYRQQEEDRRPERSIVLDPGHGIPWPWSCDPSNGGLIGARNTSSLNSGPWLRFQRPNLDMDHVSTFLTRCCGCLQLLTRIGSFGWIQILPELDYLDGSKFHPILLQMMSSTSVMTWTKWTKQNVYSLEPFMILTVRYPDCMYHFIPCGIMSIL